MTKVEEPTDTEGIVTFEDMIREFRDAFGLPTPYVGEDRQSRKILQATMIYSELLEFLVAEEQQDRVEMLDALVDTAYVLNGTFLELGFPVPDTSSWAHYVSVQNDRPMDFPEREIAISGLATTFYLGQPGMSDLTIARMLTKIQHVVSVLLRNCGFENVFYDAFVEVHRSNMSKLGEDGKPIYNTMGKVQKGPGFTPPDLTQFFKPSMEIVEPEVSA